MATYLQRNTGANSFQVRVLHLICNFLFSLGSTLYAACAGHPPFRADSPLAVLRRVCDDDARPLREVNPEVPAWLESIVVRLMARDPDKRFQTATEVANLLARCLAHVQQPLAVPLPDEAIPEEARPNAGRTRRRRWAVGTLALLAFGGGTLALMGPWEARHESGVTARHAALDDLVPVRADQITQEMQQAWSRAESLQANLHGRGDQPEHDRVLELANQLAGKVRSLERELTTGDATLRAPADLPYFQP